MPDQDGVETAAIIRRAISEPLPIILISAYDSADVETKARHAGVNGFMTKPVFMSTLCRALQRYVLGQAAADEQKSKTDFSGKRFLLVEDNALNREIAVEMLESARAVVLNIRNVSGAYYDNVCILDDSNHARAVTRCGNSCDVLLRPVL